MALGIAACQGLEALAIRAGRWSIVLPLLGTTLGAAGFTRMWRRLEAASRSIQFGFKEMTET